MICRAKTKMKSASRPLNFPHAKTYAAIDASTSTKMVTGMTMAMELTKYWERLADCEPAGVRTSA
ncbi:hypothetical protein D3C72_2475710 [compost metagenome]